jgi:phage terminase large subunit
LTGKVKGLIFGHFREVSTWPEGVQRIIWGLDLGYTNDPSALIKIGIMSPIKRVAKECCYAPGIPATEIKNILEREGYNPNDQFLYVENDPNFINQLRNLGVPAIPAIKGPGSVIAGIAKVREHECYYTADSLNFKKEIETYKFISAQDLITGKEVLTNQPMDDWNHACDAYRYADYSDSFRVRAA